MKRYTAIVHIDVQADTAEARDFALRGIVDGINSCKAGVKFPAVGAALVQRARVSRVRPSKKR